MLSRLGELAQNKQHLEMMDASVELTSASTISHWDSKIKISAMGNVRKAFEKFKKNPADMRLQEQYYKSIIIARAYIESKFKERVVRMDNLYELIVQNEGVLNTSSIVAFLRIREAAEIMREREEEAKLETIRHEEKAKAEAIRTHEVKAAPETIQRRLEQKLPEATRFANYSQMSSEVEEQKYQGVSEQRAPLLRNEPHVPEGLLIPEIDSAPSTPSLRENPSQQLDSSLGAVAAGIQEERKTPAETIIAKTSCWARLFSCCCSTKTASAHRTDLSSSNEPTHATSYVLEDDAIARNTLLF